MEVVEAVPELLMVLAPPYIIIVRLVLPLIFRVRRRTGRGHAMVPMVVVLPPVVNQEPEAVVEVAAETAVLHRKIFANLLVVPVDHRYRMREHVN